MYEPTSCRAKTFDGFPLIPGYNVDKIDLEAGMRMLAQCGYDDPKTKMVVEYALVCHAKGEEAAAQRRATDPTFYGIRLTSWYMVLAAAKAGAMQS